MNWFTMKNKLLKYGVSPDYIKADSVLTATFRTPTLDLYAFDDYLHLKYGDYEKEGKSMRDMFQMIFEDDTEEVLKYFYLD